MKRDKYGIIIQTNEDPTYEDGGDSAFSTGIMAFCNSEQDKTLMKEFVKMTGICRHPYQEKYQNPKETSRDQVKAFFAGLPMITSKDATNIQYAAIAATCLDYAKSWFVNSDFLLPADKFYLYKCADTPAPFWLYPLAYVNQAINLVWDCYVAPENEMNQAVCTNIIYGKRWIKFLYRHHPNLTKNITDYFSGWRQKAEIGVLLNDKIFREIANEIQ